MSLENNDMRILVVDDDLGLRTVVASVLGDDGYSVTEAGSGEEGLALFKANPFPLVFSDIVMNEMSGIDLLRAIKQDYPETQVIIMTGSASLDTAVAALRWGAYDYLFKPFEDLDLVSAVANRVVERIRLVSENQRLLAELTEKNKDLQQANRVLKELSIRDGLTGQYNHRHFQEALAVEVMRCQRHGRGFSLLFLDVDHFKQFNDTHGHPAGDMVLAGLADILYGRTRRSDLLARYGGEEFVILLPETPQQQALDVAEDILRIVAEHPFPGRETQPLGKVTISIGLASFPEHGQDGSALLQRADEALYQAKKAGRNRVCAWQK